MLYNTPMYSAFIIYYFLVTRKMPSSSIATSTITLITTNTTSISTTTRLKISTTFALPDNKVSFKKKHI